MRDRGLRRATSRAVALSAVAAGLVLVVGAGQAGRATDPVSASGAPARSAGVDVLAPDVLAPDALAPDTVAVDAALAPELLRPRHPGAAQARPGRTAVLPSTHTVRPGDTLGAVGQRYGVTSGALAQANALDRRATLRPGQQLVIPHGESSQPITAEEVMAANVAAEGLLADTATAYGLDSALVQAVAWQESRWQQRVVSHRGAIGMMQVRPSTGAAMADQLGRPIDLYDVTDNVVAGTAYLATLLDRAGGDVAAALAGYYQGPQSVEERGPIPATQRYVADVVDLRQRFARARDAR